jgi:two-component system response regulator (stage 0 sporulation protein A)
MFMPNIDAIDIINSYSALYASSKPCFAVISQFMSARLKNDLKNCGVGAILTKSSSAREVADIIMRVYKNKLSGSSHKSKDGISIVHAVHRTKPNAELENTVAEILCELGIPNHVPGYQYLKCAIALAVQDETMMHSVTRMLYPAIAEEFNATPSRVERRIRHAIIVAWERGDSSVIELYFGCTIDNMRGKPANSEFIAMVADRIRLNMRHAENYAAV